MKYAAIMNDTMRDLIQAIRWSLFYVAVQVVPAAFLSAEQPPWEEENPVYYHLVSNVAQGLPQKGVDVGDMGEIIGSKAFSRVFLDAEMTFIEEISLEN